MGSMSYNKGIPCYFENPEPRAIKPRPWIGHRVIEKNLSSSTRDALGAQETFVFPHPETNQIVQKLLAGTEQSFEFVKDTHFAKHLRRMKATYLFWELHIVGRRKRMLGWREILIQNLQEGSSFAERISKLITYTYRSKTGIACSKFPEEYLDEDAWGFDYFPSPFHLLPFKGECDDFLIVNKSPPIDKELKDLFQEEGSKYVKKTTVDIFFDQVDVLSTLTSKAVLIEPNKTALNLTARAAQGFPGTVTNRFVYQEKVIYKCPHEQRACWIPDISTGNSVRLVKKIVKMCLKSPADYYFRRPSFSDLQEFLSDGLKTYFIMSDLKKSGLTFPHHLVLWVKELILEKNPHLDLQVFDGLVKSTVYHEGKTSYYEPNVGLGLGMGDPLISWTISILYLIWRKRYQDEWVIQGMFWGDDQVIKVIPRIGASVTFMDVAEMANDWNRFLRSFGLTVHESKPFFSRYGCLLETYPEQMKGWDCLKRGQWVGSLFWALGCDFIYQAKEYVNAVYRSIWEHNNVLPWADRAINEVIIPYWGYEFFPEEVNYPFELGGWTQIIEEGLNQALQLAYQLPKDKGGLIRLMFLKKNRARGSRYKVDREVVKRWAGNQSPYFLSLVEGACFPDYFKPSTQREWEVYRKYSLKRRRAFQEGGCPQQLIVENFKNIPGSYELPDILCLSDEKKRDRISLDECETLDELENLGVDCLRSRIYVEQILLGKPGPPLSDDLITFGAAQIAALRTIVGSCNFLVPGLFKFCRDDPRSYPRQADNLLQRGLIIHPKLIKELDDILLPFPILDDGEILAKDHYCEAYCLISSRTQTFCNSSSNTIWSAILRRPVGNIDIYTLTQEYLDSVNNPEKDPVVEDEQEVDTAYLMYNIRAIEKRMQEFKPPVDERQQEQEKVYARYQVLGNDDESDFDLDGGIDFDNIGIG